LEGVLHKDGIDVPIASENGLKDFEIGTIKYPNYNIAASYSRQNKKANGVTNIIK
jgi:hypothetical protein